MPALRFGHVEVFVRDPSVARRFYEDVLGFEVDDVQAGGRIVWLRLGDRLILLRPGEPPASDRYSRGGPALVLFTDDLPATLAALAARGATPCSDDGPKCPLFRDPDGNWIQIVDPKDH
jgi:catechol 2,3-dioxygenase-like lactoylglutathione lyase family enzyme